MPRDQVYVFDLEGGRELQLKPLLEDLRQQAGMGAPTQMVGVGGQVRAPGHYPLEVGMTVSDLVRAGAGLDEAAYGAEAETRRATRSSTASTARPRPIEWTSRAALAGDAAADLVLQPFDYLVIKELPQWSEQETITLGGEVRFPGTYPIQRGETLSSVLKRAGGLTDLAFAEGAVFTRESLRGARGSSSSRRWPTACRPTSPRWRCRPPRAPGQLGSSSRPRRRCSSASRCSTACARSSRSAGW